ncbi:hypothetical protein CYR55_08175 [Chimaeribacter californicus]|uniref:Inner membrane protein n=1 Tax=Chimaeribacter californicus TaxID=2060067 RepID=A0A2N5EAB6_9GAMM|nr:DUF454 family protein [Chimaeribacter californicus]PLR38849.1 hypothetical protein CYR55_08175 [Chimaeribacter californicus]
MWRWALIITGWLAVVLGALGAVLPLLPTTPFLLLAAWCFSRSSPRFHHWLLYRSWFGSYLRHWQAHRALPPNTKWKAMAFTALSISISLFFIRILWVRVLLAMLMLVLLAIIWRLPVVDQKQ